MSALRVGLLGCGGIGTRHAEAIAKLDDRMRLVACCGRDADRTVAFANRYGSSPFTDFDAMLDGAALDLLVVALPPFAHNGQVETAATAGVHLLVEKPIALDLSRAKSMVDATANVVAACGFMYRHGAAVRRLDDLVASGAAGTVGHVSGSFHCNALHAPWWRSRERSGGQMVEQLIHIVDLARHWLGMPTTVYARAANLFHTAVDGYDIEDVSTMVLGYADGRIGALHASNAAIPGRWMKQWQVVSEHMTARFADFDTAEIVSTNGSAEQVNAEADVFVLQLLDVADAIRDGRAPRVPLQDGLDSLRIVLAARRSADEAREIAL